MRKNGFKLKEGQFLLNIVKKLLPYETVEPWDRLPKKVMDAPSLEIFTTRLRGSLSNMMHLMMSLLIAGLLGLDGLQKSLQAQTIL